MSNIKAIETVYKNYRFRSRLEARWAIFFDALGIAYEYEREGYELAARAYNPDGPWSAEKFAEQQGRYGVMRYLPDFWLPKQRLWVEIKSGAAVTTEQLWLERERLWRLVVATGCNGVLFHGDPIYDDEDGHWASIPQWGEGFTPTCRGYEPGVSWVVCEECGQLVIPMGCDDVTPCCHVPTREAIYGGYETIIAAGRSARSARFEHGESGAPQ